MGKLQVPVVSPPLREQWLVFQAVIGTQVHHKLNMCSSYVQQKTYIISNWEIGISWQHRIHY